MAGLYLFRVRIIPTRRTPVRLAALGTLLFASLLFTANAALTVPPIWGFVDRTVEAGLNYQHGYVDSSNSEIQRIVSGVAAADYDGDGWVDLYVVCGNLGPNLLFRNLGDGTFEEVGATMGVDLPGAVSSGPVFADYDGDGWLDLFVGGIDGTRPTLMRNLSGQSFENVTATCGITYPGNTIGGAWGDYDRDGDLDLFVSHWGEPTDQTGHLWRNEGSGFFVDVDSSAGIPLLTDARNWSFTPNFADVNNDGWADLLLAADFGNSEVYLNNRNGTFSSWGIGPLSTDENGMGAAVGDYDNDGDLDWFVSSIWDASGDPEGNWGITGNRLYKNNGNGRFVDATEVAGVREGDWGWGATFFDVNNDGHLDLFQVNGWRWAPFSTDPARLFVSRGDGTFEEQGVQRGAASTGQGRGVVCFDYDRDGDLDLFIANNSAMPVLLRNDGGNASNYLQVKLIGEAPNTQAIGARIYVKIGTTTQMREMRIGCNFASQNPVEAHFGLGIATQIDELRIVWPDGSSETRVDVMANQLLEIRKAPVPIVLSDLTAISAAGRISLAWSLSGHSVEESVGISVWRSSKTRGPFYEISHEVLLPAPRMKFLDTNASGVSGYWYRIRLLSANGASQILGSIYVEIENSLGGTFLFRPTSPVRDQPLVIRYRIGRDETNVQLTLFDVQGKRIQTLVVDGRPGTHVLTWDPSQRDELSSGTYFLRLQTLRFSESRKIVLLNR